MPAPRLRQTRVESVPDPHGRLTLVAARGDLTGSLRLELARCFGAIPDGSSLHLDLSAVHVTNSVAAYELTSLIDELEDRRVTIRVVGLDPRFPAKECHTPSS
jgi:anti-anti-sigma regulatory factor